MFLVTPLFLGRAPVLGPLFPALRALFLLFALRLDYPGCRLLTLFALRLHCAWCRLLALWLSLRPTLLWGGTFRGWTLHTLAFPLSGLLA